MHTEKMHTGAGKASRSWLAALILLQALCAGPALAQEHTEARYTYEIIKQQGIYRSEGALRPEGYVVGRALTDYEELLPTGFVKTLRELGPADRWLDVGAGQGEAILDYYDPAYDLRLAVTDPQPRGKARAVALSIEDRRTDRWRERAVILGGDQIKYLHNKRFGEYTKEELGRFRIITDVYGGFSYTATLSEFLEKVLGVLEVNGDFYTLLQSVRLENGKDNPETTWYLTELVDEDGRDVKVCAWLKRISCVQVTCDSKSTWDTPTELIRIRKTCGEVSVPKMKRLQYEAGNPPGRVFQIVTERQAGATR